MVHRGLVVLVATFAGVALVCACASFGIAPAAEGDDGGGAAGDTAGDGGGGAAVACHAPCTIADEPAGPFALALDATYVYWTSPSAGTVSRKRKDGQGDVEKIASGQAAPKSLTVSATDVYWANTGNDGGHPRTVVSQALACGTNGCLTDAVDVTATFLRWDGTFLYFARDVFFGRYDGKVAIDLCNMGNTVVGAALGKRLLFANTPNPYVSGCSRDPSAGTDPIQIAGSAPKGLAAVAVVDSVANGGVSGSDVYVTIDVDQSTTGGTSVAHVTAEGDLVPVIASGQRGAHAVAVDDTYVYWTATGDGAVRRRRRDATGGIDDIASGEDKPTALAIDGAAIYWATPKGIRSRAK